jgi:integrase
MNTNFVSNFADRLGKFFEQKQALGYSYKGTVYDFRFFDRMCAEYFPDETELTADICNAWASRRGNESNKTTERRLPFIREFARYLIRTGEQAYVLPTGRTKRGQRYIPYIYSPAEVAEMWRAFDDVYSTKVYPVAHIVLPTLIRLLYCCGLRPSEALGLRVEDVDLHGGKLFIAESKGRKDRIVMLADDVRELCQNCNGMLREFMPDRHFFFAKNSVDACSYKWLSHIFRQIREKLHLENTRDYPPRLYDLRHTFATHRLYQWMREGKDLYSMLPYLSSYMGHTKISETLYYIHLVPGMLEIMSGFKYKPVADIFPEVVSEDE